MTDQNKRNPRAVYANGRLVGVHRHFYPRVEKQSTPIQPSPQQLQTPFYFGGSQIPNALHMNNRKFNAVNPEPEIKKDKKKKKSISSTIKRLVWNTNIGEAIGKSKCTCCKSIDITQLSFNCGHIIAESNGGDTIVSNLKPICQNCNSSMGTKNMNDFMSSLV